ncbi:uncharacterized protein BXZ73DRAFT_88047 [Epithele typhae]|uniref:uncharacterized protein n=1 Tax=Epithele typhae TaxID=378194 RepID=UPI002007B4F9|nr:uncharacterized protein BXZ73DRAFT_88047 [Epithele typhae]KAH9942489.1 hypothetical protein BXZ73DRAFT_88047 [Epithele typhae]
MPAGSASLPSSPSFTLPLSPLCPGPGPGLARLVLVSDWAANFADAAYARVHNSRGTCPPDVWARGRWVPRGPPMTSAALNGTGMRTSADAYAMLGLQGCASSREVYWHLGADSESRYDRFPGVASWRWEPPTGCTAEEASGEELVRHLVEHGGWLLIGDSVTENHFFSLSCMLYPHVRATPDYTLGGFDRAWPQNLYLNSSSPILPSLKLPKDFDIENTPLVTFRRVDLLLMPSKLDALYRQIHPTSKYLHNKTTLFSDEPLWNLSPEEYVGMLTTPRPAGGYSTLIVSTGGHWTTHLFEALKDASLFNDGIFTVIDFFRDAMRVWADEVQTLLDRDTPRADGGQPHLAPGGRPAHAGSRPKSAHQVLVRAYLSGHDGCHNAGSPVQRFTKEMVVSFNWPQIGDMNRAFADILREGQYPDIHYLGIDGAALLRPDSHVASDCLHFMTGAGVLEGWTQYIWHYVTVEIPELVRSGR